MVEAAEENRKRQELFAFMDNVRELARERNREGCTILDFMAVWNEQYQIEIAKLKDKIRILESQCLPCS